MKTSTSTKPRVDEELLNAIKQEVRETIAVDLSFTRKNEVMFCAADLWNIQRRRKQRVSRRYL